MFLINTQVVEGEDLEKCLGLSSVCELRSSM